MSALKLFGIGLIFVLATVSWFVLGGSVLQRTGTHTDRLADKVSGLWGGPQSQTVPKFTAVAGRRAVDLDLLGSDIKADFKLDQRRKGLLWYATYVVDFSAKYEVSNPGTAPVDAQMVVTFPDEGGLYDGFKVDVNGKEVPVSYRGGGQAVARFALNAGEKARVETGYRTNGMNDWSYVPSPEGASLVRGLNLTINTDFAKIDFPEDGVSPTSREKSGEGWKLNWAYDSVVSGQRIGVVMPTPLNPGPLVSRIIFFAPVSLLFFFAALILLTATSSVRLHPMHYGFLAAAFFAFHLLLAYLADQIDLNLAFVIAAISSTALVFGYLRAVLGANRALVEIAISQFVFLVLFSYSFFFEGITGLAITIGSVLTLAFFMWKTASVDWDAAFARPPRPIPLQEPMQ
jgi:hypothetical protein